jgi:hypothetical protein
MRLEHTWGLEESQQERASYNWTKYMMCYKALNDPIINYCVNFESLILQVEDMLSSTRNLTVGHSVAPAYLWWLERKDRKASISRQRLWLGYYSHFVILAFSTVLAQVFFFLLVLGAYIWLVSSRRYLGMMPMNLTHFFSIHKIALNLGNVSTMSDFAVC